MTRTRFRIQVEAQKRDLAGEPGGAATQRAVDKHARGDPGTHREEHEVLALLSDALHMFADRRHVDVVLEHDRRNQCVPDGRDHLGALPSGELRGERQVIRPRTENARGSDDHLVDVLERDARLGGERLRGLAELRDDRFGGGARRPRAQRPTTAPVRSTSAARTHSRPTSRLSTHPARGLTS